MSTPEPKPAAPGLAAPQLKPAAKAPAKSAAPPPPAPAGPSDKPTASPIAQAMAGRTPAPGTTPSAAPAADSRVPGTWAAIKPGALVLATEGHAEGWFESLVIATRADDRFLLRWRDWPDNPEFTRRRDELALLHPATDPQG